MADTNNKMETKDEDNFEDEEVEEVEEEDNSKMRRKMKNVRGGCCSSSSCKAAGAPQSGEITAELMQNSQVLAALQDRLDCMTGVASGYIASLPKVVKRRIKALKKMQNEMIKIESKFYEEVHELECKYSAKYQPFIERRKSILTGDVEPTDSDCDWPSDEEESADELAVCKVNVVDELKNKAQIEEKKEENEEKKEEKEEKKDENPTGIPSFWLTILKNIDLTSEMVQDHDDPILSHLQDIKVKFTENPVGFTLEFHFEQNEYFTNTVLTKDYFLRTEPDPTDPFSYEGPEIIKCKGCVIDWKKGKNVTVKLVKKKQKHKGRGTMRTVTKTVQNDSFFNFFNPPEVTENEEPDDETEALLAADFEIGHFIRERVVPRAVLYFTGEALEEDEFEEEGEDEANEDEDGEYDEDNDPDFNPQDKPQECKQQ